MAHAADRYVATDGKPTNAGTREAPWDIGGTLGGGHTIAPGDTVWLAAGSYHFPPVPMSMGWEVRLTGTAAQPITVRALPGARVTIDGGLNVQAPSDYLVLRDLEITVSEPVPTEPVDEAQGYQATGRPWGGVNVYSGRGCKFIDLVVHHNNQGMSWWVGATDGEVCGCVFYDNGWPGKQRGHGHAIYTQNQTGWKTVRDCLFTGGWGYTLHAYGSGNAYVYNYLVEGNIAWNANTFLVGGGRAMQGTRILSNLLYHTLLQVGYSDAESDDLELRNNTVLGQGMLVKNFKRKTVEGNRVSGPDAPLPPEPLVVLRPSPYDPQRAHLAVVNGAKAAAVDVDVTAFLKAGERWRLMDPRNLYGAPLSTGTCTGPRISVPMTGEFGAWVLLRG